MTPEGLQRRTLLRGLFATGWMLYLPQLTGCENRKPSETAVTPPPDTPAPNTPAPMAETPAAPATAPDAGPAETAPSGKMAQAAAKYQSQPKNGQDCAGCIHFVAEDNSCNVVEGPISPQGWCMLWVNKPA